jgi:hypothetical protein
MKYVRILAGICCIGLIGLALANCSTSAAVAQREGNADAGTASMGASGGGAGGCGGDVRTDPQNCGLCGHGCLGGACVAGTCQPVVVLKDVAVDAIALDADYIYASISYVPLDAACAQLPQIVRFSRSDFSMTAVSPCQNGIRNPIVGMFLQPPYLFWEVKIAGPYGAVGDFMRSRLDGSETVDLGIGSQGTRFAVDDAHIYYCDVNSAIARVDFDGRNPIVLSSSPPYLGSVVVDDENVYYLTRTEPPDNSDDDDQPRQIAVFPKAGGPVTLIANGQLGILSTVSDGHVYWISSPPNGESTVQWVSTSGGTVQSFGPCYGINLALDADYVYFGQDAYLTAADAGVWRVPLSGGQAERVAGVTDAVGIVAVDDTAIVWQDNGVVNSPDPQVGLYLIAK